MKDHEKARRTGALISVLESLRDQAGERIPSPEVQKNAQRILFRDELRPGPPSLVWTVPAMDGRHLYTVTVPVAKAESLVSSETRCTCPAQGRCKHELAVLARLQGMGYKIARSL